MTDDQSPHRPTPTWRTFLAGCALVAALGLGAGCETLRDAQRTCVLLVIVDGGRYLASPAQLTRLESRVQPLLAERGFLLSHDSRNAAFVARVEFRPEPDDPLDGDFTIRVIEPNPVFGLDTANASPDLFDANRRVREQEQAFTREGQKIFHESESQRTGP